MTRSVARSAGLVAAVVGLFAGGPAAHAGVDAGTFTGSFASTCSMPYGLEGPETGPYRCDHTATSVGCAVVADTGSTATYLKTCKADLVSGRTTGSATPTTLWFGYWTCDNGAGTGSFRYRPSTSESLVFTFPVNLVVVEDQVVVSGSYTQAGTNRHIVVRASFPAICTYNTSWPSGYEGTVTPV